MSASATYLKRAWSESPDEARAAPPVHAPTIKTGLLFGLDSVATPAIEWQALTFLRRRDQMSLLHADLGWSGRGPFVGLAATLNPYLDAGLGHRFGGSVVSPYASLHVVF